VEEELSHSRWSKYLKKMRKNLKHLSINLEEGEEEETLRAVRFPKLEVLELQEDDQTFPPWMSVPPTLKLVTDEIYTNLPSISEVQVDTIFDWDQLVDRCPTLKVVILEYDDAEPEELLSFLQPRQENVEVGLEFEGVKMKPVKNLVLYSLFFTALSRSTSLRA